MKKQPLPPIPPLLLEGDHPPVALPGGPGSRYALGVQGADDAPAGEELALPESYGTRKLWLVPRDPQWLYAHWDLDRAQLAEYNQLSRDGHLILRVYDSAAPGEVVTEVHVHPESRSWFVHVGKGGGQYFAVLGFRDRTGEWNEINRSGTVGTPPDSLSETLEAEFATIPAAVSFTELIRVIRDYVAGEPILAQAVEELRASGHPGLPAHIELPPPAEFVHWTPGQQQALAQVISMEAVRQVWAGGGGGPPSSVSAAAVRREKQEKELASQAAVPGLPEAAGVTAMGAISSPHGVPPAARSFWFNVNAELVVYGATEPDARVSMGGRVIRLRKDGSFSYRFALPDGRYELPVTAVSADGFEARHAALEFARQTTYHGEVGEHPQNATLQTPAPEHTD